MIKFEARDYNELEEEIRVKSTEFSISILKSIVKALESGMDSVVLGVLPNVDIEISAAKSNYLEALKLNLHAAQDEQMYELCSSVKKWIKFLEEK